jgi:hypothetical protein
MSYLLALITAISLPEYVTTWHSWYISAVVRVGIRLMHRKQDSGRERVAYAYKAVAMVSPERLVDVSKDSIACVRGPLEVVHIRGSIEKRP